MVLIARLAAGSASVESRSSAGVLDRITLIAGVASVSALLEVSRSEGSIDVVALIAGVASESALFEVSRSEGSIDVLVPIIGVASVSASPEGLQSEGSIDVSSDIAGVASVAALARVLRSEGSVDMMLVLVLDLPLDVESPTSKTWPPLAALALDSSDRLESRSGLFELARLVLCRFGAGSGVPLLGMSSNRMIPLLSG